VTDRTAPTAGPPGAGHRPHALPARVLLGTAAALFVLTAATVATSRVEMGAFNVVAALSIAGLKASLVALFFMHLRYQGRFKAVVFATSVFFAVLLVGFVVFDTTQYQPDIRAQAARTRAKR